MGRPSASPEVDLDADCFDCGLFATDERLVQLDCHDGQRCRVQWHIDVHIGELGTVVIEESSGGTNTIVLLPIGVGRMAEDPTCRAQPDGRLAVIDVHVGRSKHSAVVGTACSGAVLVDRAAIVDQHRTVAALVVTHQDMTARQAWSGERQLDGDVRQCIGLVGFDVDELR
ncbi:MAG: hypothetical protein JWN99_746 [Ilumatobacteraceae bacterium]|nr:hypothetical protein [Ilumatobacteraceae bacterium]